MGYWHGWFVMIVLTLLGVLFPLVCSEQAGLLGSLPADILASLTEGDLLAASGNKEGNMAGSAFKGIEESLKAPLSLLQPMSGDPGPIKLMDSMAKPTLPMGKPLGIVHPIPGSGKLLKAAAIPIKKVTLKKVAGTKVLMPKLKTMAALKAKPKVYSLKPIVHIIEKPVLVYHKVPVPKKVMVPKFYPVMKPIPYPKIVKVPFKVPIKKIIPKIVKIPKAIPIPKLYPVKKPIPIGIPYPVPKFYKVPVPKPMPYKKFIPIPIPKKVPKFIPFPVKKIIKVPKPYYVPIKVPHITASYMKTPMVVKVPDIKKPAKFHAFPKPGNAFQQVNFIPSESKDFFKVKDANTDKVH